MNIILYILLILVSLVLIASVLMQQGQRQGLGAISGGAETFFGKGKSKGIDAKLQKITKIAAVVFIILAIATTIVVSHSNEAADLAPDANVENVADDAAEADAETEPAETEAAVEPADAEAEDAADAEVEPAETAAN